MQYIRLLFLFASLLIINQLQAQYPNTKWTYDLPAPAFGSAAAADMDEDGFYEIVFTTYTNDGKLHCLNAENGTPKWVFDMGGCGDVAPIIYDVTGDGVLDVIANGSCNPTIFCVDGMTGNLIWSTASGGGDSPPTIADIDADGLPEVLFGNFNGQIRILNGEDGSFNKTIQANPFENALQTEPSLADVNGDGRLDIIAANYFNQDGLHVWAFDYETSDLLWTNTVTNATSDFHAYHGGVMADVDNDGLLEYVLGSNGGFVYAINIEDGSTLWSIDIPGSNMSALSVADLDEDGELEVIFNNSDPNTFDNRIRVVSGMDGSEEWSYPITFSSFRGFSIADINGNGKLDLVSGHFMGMLRVVEPYTGLIWEKNLRLEFETANEFPWFETDHQPLIADFDQNGTLDVFAVGGYGTYQPDELNTGRAFLIEAGEGTCPEWLMFRHDIQRSGYLSTAEVEEACMPSNLEEIINPEALIISPNPSAGEVLLSYELLQNTAVTIHIYDAFGRKIEAIINETQYTGNQQISWEAASNYPVGIYYVGFSFDGEVVMRKVVLL